MCGLCTERWSYAAGLASLDAFFVVSLYVREATRRPIPRTTSLREERPQKTSQLVATHFGLPNYSKGHGSLARLPTSRKHRKPRNSRHKHFFFQIGTLMVSTNAFHSTNLFRCFHVTRPQQIAQLHFLYINHTHFTIPRFAPMKV